jgi:hypothetical protein
MAAPALQRDSVGFVQRLALHPGAGSCVSRAKTHKRLDGTLKWPHDAQERRP